MRWNMSANGSLGGSRYGNGKNPMTMNSINTNTQSRIALQALNTTNSQLSVTQKRVTTGYRVADARDDGGAFAVAQSVRSDIAGVIAVNEQLGGVKGVLETAFAALSTVSTTMKQIRGVLTRLADGAISAEQRTQYQTQYAVLAEQVGKFVDDSKYNGRTLLSTVVADGGGNISAIQNEGGSTFIIAAIDGTTLKLATTPPANAAAAQASIQDGGAYDVVEKNISTALNNFGSHMSFVENQIAYNGKKVDAMEGGLGALVDADLAKESSMLEALKVRQQLGVQTLGLANQGPQVLLGLFR
jgi:flagellin